MCLVGHFDSLTAALHWKNAHFLQLLAHRLMGNKWVRRLIFLAFAAMVATAIYGVTRMKTGITADEITPTDSHLIVSCCVGNRWLLGLVRSGKPEERQLWAHADCL